MIIAESVHKTIVQRACDLLNKRRTSEPVVEKPKTEQQKALDEFFSTKRFCEHHESARELVTLMLGYRPTPPDESSSELFSIQFCRHNKCCWILLDGTYGFRSLDNGKYTRQVACETVPSIDEAVDYLDKVFAPLDPEKFLSWCKRNMPDAKWMLEL
jgi:hypothetical protein